MSGLTHRDQILAAAERVEQANREVDLANKQLLAALTAANDAGAPLRDIAPLVRMSPSALCRRLKHERPVFTDDPLDRPVEVSP